MVRFATLLLPVGYGSVGISSRRVVITGLGLISPLGNTPEGLWEP